jgi:hypothetical protein
LKFLCLSHVLASLCSSEFEICLKFEICYHDFGIWLKFVTLLSHVLASICSSEFEIWNMLSWFWNLIEICDSIVHVSYNCLCELFVSL